MAVVLGRDAAPAAWLPLLRDVEPTRPIAWRGGGRAVTVHAFLADVAAAAERLPPGRHALTLCRDRYAFLVGFGAVAQRRQTCLLPPSHQCAIVDALLREHEASYAFGEGAAIADIAGAVVLPAPNGGRTLPADVPDVPAGHCVAIGLTSGSTGKSQAHRKHWDALHESTARNDAAIAGAFGLDRSVTTHIVATVPPQHMYGFETTVLLPLLGRYAAHADRPLFPADVARVLAEIPEPRILVTTPVHLAALLREESPGWPRLAGLVVATAPLDPELARRAEHVFGAPLLELFGATETCVIASRRTALETDWHLHPGITLEPRPDGTGVRAPYLPETVPLQDIVEVVPPSRFRLRGRNTDLLEIAGKRASLAALTRELLAVPGILDGVFVQHDEPDGSGVHRMAALAVAKPGVSAAMVRDRLRQRIDPVFLPRPLRLVDALPRNATGKLPRRSVLDALAGKVPR